MPSVSAGDNYVYALTWLGFTRTSIANPDQPGASQLAQVGHDRGTGGSPPNFGAGDGGRVVVDCDCHNGGTVMAAAEDPASGNSRVISNWQPYDQNSFASLPDMVAAGVGGTFAFAQQINARRSDIDTQPAAVYTSSGKFFGYFAPASGTVQTVDLTVTTGLSGQQCSGGGGVTGCSTDPSTGLQPLATTPWNVRGLWAGSASIGGATKYLLVGSNTVAGTLLVATIDPTTGVPTPIGSVPYAVPPGQIAIASVYDAALGQWRGFLFSAEYTAGLRVYEVKSDNTVVAVPQPAELGVTGFQAITFVTVKGDRAYPSDPPLIFLHRSGTTPTNVEIWDTAWLTSTSSQPPRLGGKVPHIGNTLPDGSILNAAGFGAKVKKSGTVVNAYVFQVVFQPSLALNPDRNNSIASNRRDVSCIAVDPTAAAAASLSITNKTHPAGPNYYGDRWVTRDTTVTGVPLIRVAWDLHVTGTPPTFAADPVPWSMTADGSVPSTLDTLDGDPARVPGPPGPGIFWPCDPTLGGNPITGSGCNASLGTPTGDASYFIGIQTKNSNPPAGPTPSTYVVPSPGILVNAPQATVAGLSVGLVSILKGDQLDASASNGNLADATMAWSFTCLGSPCGTATGTKTTPPISADRFSLSITYGDGFVASLPNISLHQEDLVAAFSLCSAPPCTALHGATLTLTNQMRKSSLPQVQLNSVDWAIKHPTCNPLTAVCSSGVFDANNQSQFLTLAGPATLPAPNPAGPYPITGYTVELTYNYRDAQNQPKSSPPVPQPFTIVDWTPAPSVGVYTDPAGTVPASFFPPPTLVINTTYYIKDTESVPNGVTYPGVDYYYSTNNLPSVTGDGPPLPPHKSDQSTLSWAPSAAQVCSPSPCYLKAVVLGVVSAAYPIIVSTSAAPLSVSVTGPSSAGVGTPVTFTANVSGGQPPYSYQWACQYAGQFTSFVPGGVTNSCSYPSATTFQVVVKVTDSQNNQVQNSPFTIVIGGGIGQLAVTISGPSTAVRGTPVTFSAQGTGGAGGYTYAWKPGEAPSFEFFQSTGSNPNFSYTYVAASTYTVTCRVTSGSSTAQGTRTITITPPLGPPAPTAAYTVQGASLNALNGTYDAEGGQTITFNAQEAPANVAPNGYNWDFADGSPRHGQQVAYAFSGAGSKIVNLTVTGDGTNRSGTASAAIPFTIHPPSFQALIVPAVEHQPVPLTNGQSFFRTDLVVANPGTVPVTISPSYLDFSATQGTNVFDLSTVTFDPAKKIMIPPKGSWSQADVVKDLHGDAATKGTLILKYEGGDATPLVTSRVYANATLDPLGPSAGSALVAVRATKDGQVIPSGGTPVELNLAGIRSDSAYYCRLSLVNSAGVTGVFRVTAVDQSGDAVTLNDPRPGGTPNTYLDFIVNPYGGVDWSGDDLGLNDPSKRYVIKVRKAPGYTTGRPMAFARLNDRATGDPSLITPDGPPEFREPCSGSQNCVNYVVPGGNRYPTPAGARWKTGLTIYNPSTQSRGLGLTYSYSPTSLQPPEQVAQGFYILGPGKLVFWDDIVAQVFATPDNHLADLTNGTAGVVRIQHYVDPETTAAPLLISARNYDDQPTGTVGSQLVAYTRPISIGPGEAPLLLTGLQQDGGSNPKPRFGSTVNVFAYDDILTVVRLTALKSDGTVLGTHYVALNNPGASGHFQPRSLGANDFTGNLNGVQNEPISVKVEVVQGGRVGAYGIIEDLTTRDPTYVQAFLQN